MNIDEIKRNAPDGANYYREFTEQYLMNTNGKWYVFREGYWELTKRPFTHELKPLD